MSALGETVAAQRRQIGQLAAEVGALPEVGIGTDRWENRRRQMALRGLRRYLIPRETAFIRVVLPLARARLQDGAGVAGAYIHAKKLAEVALVKMTWLDDKDPWHNRLGSDLLYQLGHCARLEADLMNGLRGRLGPGEDAGAAARLERLTASRWLPTRPHPDLPAGSLVSRLLGPPSALSDRIRDSLDPPALG